MTYEEGVLNNVILQKVLFDLYYNVLAIAPRLGCSYSQIHRKRRCSYKYGGRENENDICFCLPFYLSSTNRVHSPTNFKSIHYVLMKVPPYIDFKSNPIDKLVVDPCMKNVRKEKRTE